MASELIFTRPFEKSFDKLNTQERREVDHAVMELRRGSEKAGLRLEKLRGRASHFHSISPNMDLRVIVQGDGGRWVLLYVGHHDKAYEWACRSRLERHPVTGSMQIVDIVDARTHPTPQPPKVRLPNVDEAETGPIFASEDDEYLVSLGVPPSWVPRVKTIADEDELVALGDRLPEEAWEKLVDLANGDRPTPLAPAPAHVDPYATPDAQRRFRVVADDDALERALSRPWPEWAVWLHPAQRDAVEREWRGAARVTGQAGTGKSVVAMHRAARLARSGSRVLLTTFSKVLAQRLAAGLDLLLDDDPRARERITARHLHAHAVDVLRRARRRVSIIDDNEVQQLIANARRESDLSGWTDAFLNAEWSAVMDYWGVRTEPSYKAVPRTGRGTPLAARERSDLWRVFGTVRDRIDASGKMTWSDACEAACDAVAPDDAFDVVIVDEAQDFGPRELALAVHLSRQGPAGLFFAGDIGQRIYKYPFPWTAVGIDVRGRSRRLRINYRTSSEIRTFADRLLPPSLDEIGGGEEQRMAASLFNGPAPDMRGCRTQIEEERALRDWISSLIGDGLAASEIAVLARQRRRANDVAAMAVKDLGLRRQPFSESDPDAVYAGTLHGAKGLEFRAVAIVGCEDDQIPLAKALSAEIEEEARLLVEERERHLLYVGCTRARDALLLTYRGVPSRFLDKSNSVEA